MAVISCRLLAVATLLLVPACVTEGTNISAVSKRIKPSYWTRKPVEGQAATTGASAGLLRLTFDEGRRSALAAEITSRRGVATYSTTDPITFTLRSERLVETRGLPQDLMSAEPGPDLASLISGDHYVRRWQVLGADDLIGNIRLNCTARVDVSAGTRSIEETCSNENFCVVNQFVTTSAHALIRSRQWIGPTAGYALILRPDQPAPGLPASPCEVGRTAR